MRAKSILGLLILQCIVSKTRAFVRSVMTKRPQLRRDELNPLTIQIGRFLGSNPDDGFTPSLDETEIPDDVKAELAESAPSEAQIMKEVLGISGFTYILAALIVFFLGMNFILGPGWLGSSLGIKGTGTFEQVSDSLPDIIDLSEPDFRI